VRRFFKPALVVSVVWLAFYLLTHVALPRGTVAFGKYIYSPVPMSVREIRSQINDWFGIMPEPVCYFSFQIGNDDVHRIVKGKGFRAVSLEDMFSPGGPAWFQPGRIGTNGQFYRRTDQRRNTQYLWIDATGTNGFFLYWGV
jgi:hypothetical protein